MQDAPKARVNIFLLGCLLWLGPGVWAYVDRDCPNLYACLYPLDDYDLDMDRPKSPREVIRNVEEDVLGFCRPFDLQHTRAMRSVMERTTCPGLGYQDEHYNFDNLLDRLVSIAYADAGLETGPGRYGRTVAYNLVDEDTLREHALPSTLPPPSPKTVRITFELPVGEQSSHLDTLYKLNELLRQRTRERWTQAELSKAAPRNGGPNAVNSTIVSETTLECENGNHFFPCPVSSEIQLSKSPGTTDLTFSDCGPNSHGHGCVKMAYNTTGIIEPVASVEQRSGNETLSEEKRGGFRFNAFGRNYTYSLPNKMQRILFM